MTDIRSRLAMEWLSHQHTGCGFCRCGHRPDHGLTPLEAQAVHVADVLLSLPGIAIVDIDDVHPEDWDLEILDGDITDTDPGDSSWSPRTARWFAAALLAAAVQAQEER